MKKPPTQEPVTAVEKSSQVNGQFVNPPRTLPAKRPSGYLGVVPPENRGKRLPMRKGE